MDALLNDVHFGHRKGSNWHRESLLRFFYEQFIPELKEKKIENVWMLGDLFENRHSVTYSLIDDVKLVLQEIAKAISGKVYLLVGNHDLKYKNDMTNHNFSSYEDIPNLEVLVGKGVMTLGNYKLAWCSYDIEDTNILNFLKKSKADIFFGHLETTGYNVIKYINENMTAGYSGHIHQHEIHGNFQYLPSTQQNATDEVDSIHGYSLIDWETGAHEMVDNRVSGKFKTICFGTNFTEEDIFNNYITMEIDKILVKKLSTRKVQQDFLISEFIAKVKSFKPSHVFDTAYIDSSVEKFERDMEGIKKIETNIENKSDFDADILRIAYEHTEMYADETIAEIQEFMNVGRN